MRLPAVSTSVGWGLRACSGSGCKHWGQQWWEAALHVLLTLWASGADSALLTCFFVTTSLVWPPPREVACQRVHSSVAPLSLPALQSWGGWVPVWPAGGLPSHFSFAILLLQPGNGSTISSLSWERCGNACERTLKNLQRSYETGRCC